MRTYINDRVSSARPVSSISTSSPASTYDAGHRPKSVPAHRQRAPSDVTRRMNRPLTAAVPGYDCERLGQVERESVKQHKLQSHLPMRKDKPPPWQAQLELERVSKLQAQVNSDGVQKPIYIAPGYILSRSKSKYQMVIKDKLFESEELRSQQQKQAGHLDPEIAQMIESLKQQVADLNVYLEEERLQHRETKRKSAEFLQDKVNEMKNDHKEAMRRLNDEHEQLMTKTLVEHQQEILERTEASDAKIAKYKTEVEFLQGAFETYKSQSNIENNKRLKDLQAELEDMHDKELESKLQELAKKLRLESNAAIATLNRENSKALSAMEKQCQREVEALNRRFANHAADVRKLKEAELKHKDLEMKLEDAVRVKEEAEKELITVKRDQSDLKVKLSVFERQFEDKVAEVDARYKSQIADLMEQNTNLRKQYMKKCEELFTVSAKTERDKYDQLQTSKDLMKALIESRTKANVSIVANNPNIKKLLPKDRPCSAPSTKLEEYKAALSAGETDAYVARREVPFVRPQSVLEMSEVFNVNELTGLTKEELAQGLA